MIRLVSSFDPVKWIRIMPKSDTRKNQNLPKNGSDLIKMRPFFFKVLNDACSQRKVKLLKQNLLKSDF